MNPSSLPTFPESCPAATSHWYSWHLVVMEVFWDLERSTLEIFHQTRVRYKLIFSCICLLLSSEIMVGKHSPLPWDQCPTLWRFLCSLRMVFRVINTGKSWSELAEFHTQLSLFNLNFEDSLHSLQFF